MPPEFNPRRRTDRDVIAYAEFTGLRNDVASEHFDSTDLAVADNVNIDKARRISRRAGATVRSALPAHSLWADHGDALFASGQSLYRMNEALVPALLTATLSGAPVCYARAGDDVLFSDGTNIGIAGATGTRSWGIAVPEAVLATIVAGDFAPGTYGVAATYVRSDGQESGAPPSVFVTLGEGQGLMLTVPPSLDPDVLEKRLYVTMPNGDVLFHAATLDNNDGPMMLSREAFTVMDEPLTTQFLSPPPAGQLIAYYKGRVFVAVGSVLYPSEPFAYELFDLRNYIQMDDDITMLAPMEDLGASGFFIGTKRSSGVLAGDSPEKFEYVPKTTYGAIKGALAFVDGSLYLEGEVGARELPMWLSTEGVCVGLPSLAINNLTRGRYTFPADGVGAALFDPKDSRFVAVSGANPAIVIQLEVQAITTYTSYAYNSFARFNGKLFGASAAGLFELVGDDDNGQPIAGTVSLGTTDFGSAFMKAVDRLFVGYRSRADMTLRVTTEGAYDDLYTLPVSAAPELASQRVKLGRGLCGRYWQFTLLNIGGAYFEIDAIDVKTSKLDRRINGRA